MANGAGSDGAGGDRAVGERAGGGRAGSGKAGGDQAEHDPLGLGKPVEAVPCPHCGAPTTVLIGRALETSGCTHFAEGAVFAFGAGAAGKYYAEEKGWPWLTAVGVLVGVLILAVTIWVIRDANRTAARARVAVDRTRAKGVAATHYCGACREASAPGAPAPS
ncbi:hypothetical protein [Streptomyces sp. NBC_00096]|uniref:hypothetical protein n=1 Tax=Streptomyces sp. NBC_00096 TaxID=2975650 RepID=UPI003245E9A2